MMEGMQAYRRSKPLWPPETHFFLRFPCISDFLVFLLISERFSRDFQALFPLLFNNYSLLLSVTLLFLILTFFILIFSSGPRSKIEWISFIYYLSLFICLCFICLCFHTISYIFLQIHTIFWNSFILELDPQIAFHISAEVSFLTEVFLDLTIK
jgi:hypothetical protein